MLRLLPVSTALRIFSCAALSLFGCNDGEGVGMPFRPDTAIGPNAGESDGGNASAGAPGADGGGGLDRGTTTVSAIVGPMGGTLEFPGGIRFTVPPGALSSETKISGTLGQAPPTLHAVQAEGRLGFVAMFEPEGLVFDELAKLVVPITSIVIAPSGGAPLAFFSVPSAPLDATGEEGDPQLEVLSSTQDSNSYIITIPHFSSVAAVWGSGRPLKDLMWCNFATLDTLFLSWQVRFHYEAGGARLEQIAPNDHIAVTDLMGGYLHPGALNDLYAVAATLDKGIRIVVNWAWRSLPTAYVVKRTCPVAADPGLSLHQRGAAIDVATGYKPKPPEERISSAETCFAALRANKIPVLVDKNGKKSVAEADWPAALDIVHPKVGAALEKGKKFRWKGCGDYMHFDWQGDGIPSDNTLANQTFKELWNLNNPCYQLDANGTVESTTLLALGASPSQGFDHTIQKDLPETGVQGAGCQSELMSNAAGGICCPGAVSTAPSCQSTCDPGLIAYWRFDDGSGQVAHDYGGGHNGFIYGADWTTGYTNGGLQFHDMDSYVDVSSVFADLGTHKGTYSLWFKPTAFGPYSFPYYGRKLIMASGRNGIMYGGDCIWVYYIDAALQMHTVKYDIGFASKWYHVASTWDGVNVKLYLDGTEVGSTSAGDWLPYDGRVLIGAEPYQGPHESFPGFIDEVAIFNVPLTASGIQERHSPSGR